MSREELMLTSLHARVVNMTRGEKDPPYIPDWPWPDASEDEPVTDEERAALKSQLQATSAFGQIRTEGPAHV